MSNKAVAGTFSREVRSDGFTCTISSSTFVDFLDTLESAEINAHNGHRLRLANLLSITFCINYGANSRVCARVDTPYDITIHLEREPVPIICMSSFFTMLNLVNAGGLVGTSLQGTRSVREFLDLLKAIISPDDFRLQTLENRQDVDVEGTIHPGRYVVGMVGILVYYVPLSNFPCVLVGEAQEYALYTMMSLRKAATLLSPVSGKKRKLSTADSPEGGRSQRVCQH